MAEAAREAGYSTEEVDEMEKQFLADLEKAKALSMETAALEKFKQMSPPSRGDVDGGLKTSSSDCLPQRRATYHLPSKTSVDHEKGRIEMLK